MKIIIAGGGETGTHLAASLSRENQDVVLMDSDSEKLDELDSRFNIMTCEGSPVSPADLIRAGAPECDLFVGVTPYEDINIISAQIARRLGAARTVARIDNAEFMSEPMQKLFRDTGVDRIVFPELLAARQIAGFLKRNWSRDRFELHDGALIVTSVLLDATCEAIDTPLRELEYFRDNLHVCAIRRGETTIIPHGDDILQTDDIVYFSILPGGEPRLMALCGKENAAISRILVAGAGKMTSVLAEELGDEYALTVVDSDRSRCRRLSMLPRRITVVNADQRDIDVLREEGTGSAGAFIALNDSSEANIVSCMLARQMGARRTIAEIEDTQYFSEADKLGIDTVVNKKLMTSSHIFQSLLDSILDTPRCLALDDAEVLEIIASEGSTVTKGRMRDIPMPAGMTVAGLVRQGKGMLVNGETRITAGDHVVVFCLRGLLGKVERLFK